jgi:DNA-binding HxlR family transcriptional regulator
MLKSVSVHDETLCPIVRASQVVGDTWVLLIVRTLIEAPLRFNRLLESIDGIAGGRKISSRTLAQRLRDLEEAGLVRRSVCSEAPTYAEYVLTEKGRALKPVLDSLREYGGKYL